MGSQEVAGILADGLSPGAGDVHALPYFGLHESVLVDQIMERYAGDELAQAGNIAMGIALAGRANREGLAPASDARKLCGVPAQQFYLDGLSMLVRAGWEQSGTEPATEHTVFHRLVRDMYSESGGRGSFAEFVVLLTHAYRERADRVNPADTGTDTADSTQAVSSGLRPGDILQEHEDKPARSIDIRTRNITELELLTSGRLVDSAVSPQAVQAFLSKIDTTFEQVAQKYLRLLVSPAWREARARSGQASFPYDRFEADILVLYITKDMKWVIPDYNPESDFPRIEDETELIKWLIKSVKAKREEIFLPRGVTSTA